MQSIVGLAESVYGTEDVLVDVSAIAETVGLAQWHSPAQWNMAKLPFADELVPLYADYVARTIAALRGKSRRCLVLDLDNTVWGGVIGDDGLEGIKVAQETRPARRIWQCREWLWRFANAESY
ncbi:hypothetical protein RBB78_15635 [Tunturiibacter empetritectus]|uniref:hypothetical protein n=1 Tax=Tunturiibacter empetritectus TaxID=3069691 RepID=UPI003D9B7A5B